MGFIFRTRSILFIYLAQVPLFFWIVTVTVWGPSFFIRQYNMNVASASTIVGIIMIFVSIGHLGGGWFSDRLVQRSPRGRVTAAMALVGLACLLYTVSYLGSMNQLPFLIVVIGLCVGQMFFAGHFGCLVAACLDLMPPHFRGTCQSFIPLFQTGAAFMSGGITGLVSDQVGLTMALLLTELIMCVLALAIMFFAHRSYNADYEKQKSLGTYGVELV